LKLVNSHNASLFSTGDIILLGCDRIRHI
jgi:hypothetical protein